MRRVYWTEISGWSREERSVVSQSWVHLMGVFKMGDQVYIFLLSVRLQNKPSICVSSYPPILSLFGVAGSTFFPGLGFEFTGVLSLRQFLK